MFKSIKTSVLALILVSTAIIAHAQTKITEGTIVYTMDAAGASQETTIKFKDEFTTLNIEAGPATISIIRDNKNGTGLVLVDVPVAQKQIASKMTKEDVDGEQAKAPKFTDFKATGVKEMVAGYNAEKYTLKDDKGAAAEVWITTDLDVPNNMVTYEFKELKGTPVKYKGTESSFVVKSVKAEKVGELSVTKIPAGYEEMSYADMRAMNGGGE